jgi:hypothetical protein
MSDHSISIVPKLSTYPNKEPKGKQILEWLISLDVVKPEPSDCTLSNSLGFSISEGAKGIVKEPSYLPYGLVTNGLEVITQRQVFDTGENGIETAICPTCGGNIAEYDWSFFNEWDEGSSTNITCPLCNVSTNIHLYVFTPEWGFSDLGFKFWNWPEFKENFIEDFKSKLGCEVSIVFQHL